MPPMIDRLVLKPCRIVTGAMQWKAWSVRKSWRLCRRVWSSGAEKSCGGPVECRDSWTVVTSGSGELRVEEVPCGLWHLVEVAAVFLLPCLACGEKGGLLCLAEVGQFFVRGLTVECPTTACKRSVVVECSVVPVGFVEFVVMDDVMACERRSTDVVWLLEKSPTSSFPGNRLPSRGEVVQVFLFHHKIQKEVLFAAAASTPEKVLEVWQRANIPTSDVSWVKKKILKLYEEYGALAKSKSRKTETSRKK
ncbi:hypothetical protein GWK47_029312 [Chionoecetes opilio]|uniref:Uncharacterized protein n=1 Tax=Chionoecetes opilio TaxID=41210 RepID=A0A8J4YSJ9_CHIOP|nr:hypothetical protein GWK47_033225 [Chionoecetes opilio]KAG0729939.1 hypothetical protein GWK47_029312 [Chionoecetes opilio]